MNHDLMKQQLSWWLSNEPQLLTKLEDSLNKQFDELPNLSVLLTECLKFLYLAGHAQQADGSSYQKFTPSVLVDEAWHCLILHTRSYHQFCQQFYGAFIHHHPGGDEATNHKQLQTTLYALQDQFGKLDANVWPASNVLDISGKCSACES